MVKTEQKYNELQEIVKNAKAEETITTLVGNNMSTDRDEINKKIEQEKIMRLFPFTIYETTCINELLFNETFGPLLYIVHQ